jgi:hypothetical protein
VLGLACRSGLGPCVHGATRQYESQFCAVLQLQRQVLPCCIAPSSTSYTASCSRGAIGGIYAGYAQSPPPPPPIDTKQSGCHYVVGGCGGVSDCIKRDDRLIKKKIKSNTSRKNTVVVDINNSERQTRNYTRHKTMDGTEQQWLHNRPLFVDEPFLSMSTFWQMSLTV